MKKENPKTSALGDGCSVLVERDTCASLSLFIRSANSTFMASVFTAHNFKVPATKTEQERYTEGACITLSRNELADMSAKHRFLWFSQG